MRNGNEPAPPETLAAPRAVLGPTLLLGLAAGLLLASSLPLLNPTVATWRDLGRLASGLALAGVVLGGALGLVLALAARLVGSRPAWGLALLVAVVFVARAVYFTADDVAERFGDVPASRLAVGLALAAAGVLVALAALGARSRRSLRRAAIGLALLPVLALGVFLALPDGALESEGETPSFSVAEDGQGVLLVGFDGADWELMETWIAEGRLPHFARLREEGVWGPLQSFKPCKSPLLWTSMVSGKAPRRHGIRDFVHHHVPGIDTALEALELPRQVGLESLQESLLERRASDDLVHVRVPDSTERAAETLWTITSMAREPAVVVNWWSSWPAEAVHGAMVSERLAYWRLQAKRGIERPIEGMTHPESLYRALHPRLVAPADVTADVYRRFMDVDDEDIERLASVTDYFKHQLESEFKYIYSMEETMRRATHVTLDAVPDARLVLTYFRGVDVTCHCAMQFMPRYEDALVSASDRRRYGRTVRSMYEWTDEILGEMAAIAEAKGLNLVVVSDHGFRKVRDGKYGHGSAPAGILIARGPAFARGRRVENVTVTDIGPTVLHVMGYPVGEDMDGRVATEILADPDRPVRRIPTYERGGRRRPAPESVDDDVTERLRAIGYIK